MNPRIHGRAALLATLLAQPATATTIYTATNDAAANRLYAFTQTATGGLAFTGVVPTGGRGNGGLLINQAGIALSADKNTALVVNAGSNSIAAISLTGSRLTRTAVAPSGGQFPNSIAVRGNVAFVLNSGSNTVQGFTLGATGTLTPIPGTNATLGTANAGGAQIAFSADGSALIVTGHASNTLIALPLGAGNIPGRPVISPSAGANPLGFAVAPDGTIVVSETNGDASNAGTMSTYRLQSNFTLKPISARVPARQSATCWVAITPDGKYAYASNTLSATITQFALGTGGTLTRVPANGISASTGNGHLPLDIAIDPTGHALFALDFGAPGISAFTINADGTLRNARLRTSGIPGSANGLVVR